jgi:hypothetical protein
VKFKNKNGDIKMKAESKRGRLGEKPEESLTPKERNLTANPGDRIADEPQSIGEKAKQLAVDSPDITGDHIKVPTYFIVEYPNGERKALHHVKDAQEISDVIRMARMDENGNRVWW